MSDRVDQQIVTFILAYQAAHGHSPSLAEIGSHIGLTKQGANWRVRALLEAGVLSRKAGQPRTLTVIAPEGVFA